MVQFAHAPPIASGGVEYRKIKLLVAGIERDEQVKHFIDNRIRASIGTVNLVDYYDRPQTLFQSFAEHKLGLRHRAFCRIGQQNDPIGHVQYALDLTAEIGMPRRVDNIDARIVPHYRSWLGKNCNAAFFFQIA